MTVELSHAKQEKLAASNVAEQGVVPGVRPEHIVSGEGLRGTVDVSNTEYVLANDNNDPVLFISGE